MYEVLDYVLKPKKRAACRARATMMDSFNDFTIFNPCYASPILDKAKASYE
jgi:hypothetical protein